MALANGIDGAISPSIAEVQATIAALNASHVAFELSLQQGRDALFADYERNKVGTHTGLV